MRDAQMARTPARSGSDMKMRVPTSELLGDLLDEAPADFVTLAWLIGRLRERSFGMIMLVIGLVALAPGASMLVGLLLVVPAVQMMLAREGPVFPRFVAERRLPTPQIARIVKRIIPLLRRIEKVIHPRWRTPFEPTKRVVGFVILLLGGTLLAPLPFFQIIPALVIVLLSFAFLEEDGILLGIALAAALTSLAITAAAVWGSVEAISLL